MDESSPPRSLSTAFNPNSSIPLRSKSNFQSVTKKEHAAGGKWRRLLLFAAIVVASAFALPWIWNAYVSRGTAVPGTSIFRTYYDSAHGMADTVGTFDLPGGDSVSVRCWSPGVIQRTKFFDFYLHYSGYPGWPRPGVSGVQDVKVTAGSLSATFGAAKCTNILWINGVPREQLRQIVAAPEVVFNVDKGKNLILHEDQLAQIRGLITYTDTLPLFDFPPDNALASTKNGR
jgi:hypothetical protein